MLLTDGNIVVDEFLDEFKKRFSNFCSKAPVILTFKITPSSCFLKDCEKEIVHKFEFDHLSDVKANIKIIKDWLIENVYPRMIEENFIEEDYSNEEIEKLIESGMNEEDAIMKKKIRIEEFTWIIEKLIIKRDELFIRNIDTDRTYRYKIKMPSTLFLKKIRNGSMSQKEIFSFFYSKSELLNEDKPEWRSNDK